MRAIRKALAPVHREPTFKNAMIRLYYTSSILFVLVMAPLGTVLSS
jgi:hypothetical protein